MSDQQQTSGTGGAGTTANAPKVWFITGASRGFGHAQSFSKLFKAKTSIAPLAFRQSFN